MRGCSSLVGMGIVVFLYLGGIMFAIFSVIDSLPSQLILAWVMLILPCILAFKQSRQEKENGSKYHLFYLLSAILPIPLLLFSTVTTFVYSSSCADRLQPDGHLVSCNFDGADLRNLDLHGSDFSRATLRNASLQGTNLENANLEYADLENADLTNAFLKGVRLSNTKLINVTGLHDELLANLLGVPLVDLPRALASKVVWLESEEEIRNTLANVCRGKAVVQSAIYSPNHEFHPLVLLQSNGYYHQWTSNVRTLGWSPMAVRHAELVACIGEQKAMLIQRCGYTGVGGGSYERYQYQMSIELIASNTLEVIAETSLAGGSPLDCPKAIAAGSHDSDYGSKVNFEAVEDWLATYMFSQ